MTDIIRASAIQRGMWLASQIAPDSAEFTVSTATRVTGPLDRGALERALASVVARHPILRARFVERDGAVVVEPVADAGVSLAVTDLSAEPPEQAWRRARRHVERMADRPFDMSRAPLLRAGLIRVAGDEHVIHLDLHHAVCDGWTLRLLIRELGQAYSGTGGAGDDAPPTYWEYLSRDGTPTDEELDADLAYWTKTLAGVRPLGFPPPDDASPRPEVAGAQTRFIVDEALLARVDELAGRLAKTRFMVLLAALQAVLARMCATPDIPVGTTLSLRDDVAAERVIGPLFNTAVLRSDLRGEPRFAELADRAEDCLLGALEHLQVPFESVLSAARGRTSSRTRNPLFNVLFELDYDAEEPIQLTGARAEPFPFGFTTPKADLCLAMTPSGTDLLGTVTYRPAACDARTAAGVGERLVAVLRAVTGDGGPDLRLHELPLATPGELAVIEARSDGGPAELPSICLHELIAAQARRTPDAVAVRELGPGAARGLTYAELDARADHLARRMAARGVGPETRVAIHMSRSADLVAAILGVLKAGGAYVPLDPAFPLPRLRTIADDSGAVVVLTERRLAAEAARIGPPILLADDAQPDDAGATPVPGSPRNLAYVMYTSGSTGRPKGVLVEHRGLVNFVMWCVRRYVPGGSGGAPLFSSIAFDMVVPNLFAPLVAGQTVSVVPESVPPSELGAVLSAAGPFGFIKLTPGHLELLARRLTPEQARSLAGLLVVGADAFPRTTLAAWRRLDPYTPMLNEYGPTEASVANSAHELVDADAAGVGDLPIGLPIPNTTLHVLDRFLNRVPPGVTGELYIGGVCVVRGYAGRPAITASRFVPDPYGPPGARLYRTGDLARRTRDGNVEFLGRADQQVKIRGYRIEPAEVEAALAAHPAVRRAVVTAVRAPSGHTALAAYVVARPPARPSASTLRADLGKTLPAYLVPAVVTWLDTLPLNENGKVDRSALPEPEWEATGHAGSGASDARTRELAEIWSTVLGLPADAIGPDDDFFALGGDSMLVLSLLDRIRERYGHGVSFEEVLRSPTIADLALLIGEDSAPAGTAAPHRGAVTSLRRIDGGAPEDGPPLVLAHPVGGTLFCYRDLITALRPDRPVYGLTLAALLDPGAADEPSLEAMAARYAAEIAARVDGPVTLAGWSAGALIAFETARRLIASGGDVVGLALLDPSAPDDQDRWLRHAREIDRLRAQLDRAGDRPDAADLDTIADSEVFAGMGVDPASVRPGDRSAQNALAAWQHQCTLLGGYRPGTYRGDVALVTSHDDGTAARWRALVSGEVRSTTVGGGHLEMLRPPHAGSVAHALGELLSARRSEKTRS